MPTPTRCNHVAAIFLGAILGVALTVVVSAWWMQDRAIVRAVANYAEPASPWAKTITRDQCITIYSTREDWRAMTTPQPPALERLLESPRWSCVVSRGWLELAQRADSRALQAP